jgi:hypothetical protein
MTRQTPWLLLVLLVGACASGGESDTLPMSPITLLDAQGSDVPIGSVTLLDPAAVDEITIRLLVEAEDVAEPLTLRWRIEHESSSTPPPFVEQSIAPTGGPTREVSVPLRSSDLLEGLCNRIDVAVSANFLARNEPLFFDVTKPADDAATAFFWVWAGPAPSDAGAHNLSCGSLASNATNATDG